MKQRKTILPLETIELVLNFLDRGQLDTCRLVSRIWRQHIDSNRERLPLYDIDEVVVECRPKSNEDCRLEAYADHPPLFSKPAAAGRNYVDNYAPIWRIIFVPPHVQTPLNLPPGAGGAYVQGIEIITGIMFYLLWPLWALFLLGALSLNLVRNEVRRLNAVRITRSKDYKLRFHEASTKYKAAHVNSSFTRNHLQAFFNCTRAAYVAALEQCRRPSAGLLLRFCAADASTHAALPHESSLGRLSVHGRMYLCFFILT